MLRRFTTVLARPPLRAARFGSGRRAGRLGDRREASERQGALRGCRGGRAGGRDRPAGHRRALGEQGARRAKPPSAGGAGTHGRDAYTGLKWDPPSVAQNYNASGQRLNNAKLALTNSYSDWSTVLNSAYRIGYGGDHRTATLVDLDECPGVQGNDGNNDVGWASLGGSTLGVTWFTPSTPEADMALDGALVEEHRAAAVVAATTSRPSSCTKTAVSRASITPGGGIR